MRQSTADQHTRTNRADTYQLIRAGLTGGKGVPADIFAQAVNAA